MENQTNPKKIFISNFVYSISIISSVSRGVYLGKNVLSLKHFNSSFSLQRKFIRKKFAEKSLLFTIEVDFKHLQLYISITSVEKR